MKLTDSEKLDLINTMEFIDFDADCEGIVYVLVEDNDKNRGILHKIGLTNEDIEKDCFVEDGTMDVSMVAFRYSNYYNAKEGVFYNEDEVYGVIEEVKQTLSLLEDIKRREKELGISGPDLDMQIESEKIKLEALKKMIDIKGD